MVHLEWAHDGDLGEVVVGVEVDAEVELPIGCAWSIYDVELNAFRCDGIVDLQCV